MFEQVIAERLPLLYFLVALIVMDTLGGALVAVRQGRFKLEKLPEFLIDAGLMLFGWVVAEVVGLLPLVIGADPSNPVVAAIAEATQEYGGKAVFVFVAMRYIASIFGHIATIKSLPLGAYRALDKVGIEPTGADKPQG